MSCHTGCETGGAPGSRDTKVLSESSQGHGGLLPDASRSYHAIYPQLPRTWQRSPLSSPQANRGVRCHPGPWLWATNCSLAALEVAGRAVEDRVVRVAWGPLVCPESRPALAAAASGWSRAMARRTTSTCTFLATEGLFRRRWNGM